MARYGMAIDTKRCVGCNACTTACKMANNVPDDIFWTRALTRGGDEVDTPTGTFPNLSMRYYTVGCQHCENPECVSVCPTGASQKMEDGTVQIDKSKCIGCQFCVMACPYGVRYLNTDERVVEKCTLCAQQTAEGALPQCVAQCGGRARFFGDLDEGLDSFVGPINPGSSDATYDEMHAARVKMNDFINP